MDAYDFEKKIKESWISDEKYKDKELFFIIILDKK